MPILPVLLLAARLAAAAPSLQPPGVTDQDAAVGAAYAAAQAMQGPLDGLWALDDLRGRTLFVFDLSDPGGPPAPLAAHPDDPGIEGAWRDPRRPGGPGASGLVDDVRARGRRLVLRFSQGPGQGQGRLTVSLVRRPDGRWRGTLAGDGPPRRVVMSRF